MPPRTIEEYVHWVLSDDPTLAKVDPAVIKRLEEDYVRALEDEITAALISSLPEDKLEDAEKLLDHSSVSDLKDWLEQQVPEMQDIISGILLQFKDDYLSANDVN
ncbi:MAG TPA: hypothetical protein VMS08_02565 [Candidatus Saccharimonadia bacterium]|nr:hypothetical protein [Candidatus Saccharimonadia bacterium]